MASPERIAIRLASGAGESFGVDDIAVAAATSLEFWSKEGLDVSWTPARGGVRAIEALLDDQVDVAYGTFAPAITQRAAGKPVKIVCSMARGLAQQLVVRQNINTTADLKGAKWAVDGIGALSHNMARLVVRGLDIPDDDVHWDVAGPPPQRIAKLISGEVDCALVRVEEATVLVREHPNTLRCLLGFEDLKQLVPLQPHGVLTTTETFLDSEKGQEAIRRLVRGLLLVSELGVNVGGCDLWL